MNASSGNGTAPRLMTVRQLADYLGVPAKRIRSWQRAKVILGFWIGARLFFDRETIEAWLRACQGDSIPSGESKDAASRLG